MSFFIAKVGDDRAATAEQPALVRGHGLHRGAHRRDPDGAQHPDGRLMLGLRGSRCYGGLRPGLASDELFRLLAAAVQRLCRGGGLDSDSIHGHHGRALRDQRCQLRRRMNNES